jgi:hypothetical protein
VWGWRAVWFDGAPAPFHATPPQLTYGAPARRVVHPGPVVDAAAQLRVHCDDDDAEHKDTILAQRRGVARGAVHLGGVCADHNCSQDYGCMHHGNQQPPHNGTQIEVEVLLACR